ncbi:MAG: VWA domain-containing protein [bacterium]
MPGITRNQKGKGKITKITVLLVLLFFLLATGCQRKGDQPEERHARSSQEGGGDTFTILSGSENETLEPILKKFAESQGVNLDLTYKGSVDIMLALGQSSLAYDGVWPANSLWISLGDSQHRVKHLKSIMTSPVVFGIRKSLARNLGFVGQKVRVKDILSAIRQGKLRFMMTSASQSNSGASAYIGFLYALCGNPEIITGENLHNPELKTQIRELLSGINRSSGSSGWLKDLFLEGGYEAMVNYESVIIETNQELVKRGMEPLYVIYPVDGIVLADSPLGYINRGKPAKEEFFKKLQEYLLSDEVQRGILKEGRRTGFGGIVGDADKRVFNPEWGIETVKILSPIKLPSAEVIREAIVLYQENFRKPSFTVFCLDFSGSMEGNGERQLKEAMSMLIDQDRARQYLIQATSEDVMVVVPFSSRILDTWQAVGNNREDLDRLLSKVMNFPCNGGTDIFTPAIAALNTLAKVDITKYIPAIILMTDGESNTGKAFVDLQAVWRNLGYDIPVFPIMFGDASERQLKQIAALTRGRIFDGRKDLVDAFRKARGYN